MKTILTAPLYYVVHFVQHKIQKTRRLWTKVF